jgi:hypothetical protein
MKKDPPHQIWALMEGIRFGRNMTADVQQKPGGKTTAVS